MRTTVKLDEDVVRLIRGGMLSKRQSLEHAVNEALRKALLPGGNSKSTRKAYKVRPLALKLRKGIDPDRLKDYINQEDDERFLRMAKDSTK